MVRRQGMPMVVTDEAGKSPVVVLPLEVYEALTDGVSSTAPKKEVPVLTREPLRESEISLEERFYIEPLDQG